MRRAVTYTAIGFIAIGSSIYLINRAKYPEIASIPASAARMNAEAIVSAEPLPRLSSTASSQEAPQVQAAPVNIKHERFRALSSKALRHSAEKSELAVLVADPQLASRHFGALENGAPELERMQAIDWLEAALKYQEPSLRAQTARQILAILADPALAQQQDGQDFRSRAGDRIELALVLITQDPSMRAAALQAIEESGLNGLAKIVAGRSQRLSKN